MGDIARETGLSLIELIVFIIVVSVGLAGVLVVLNATVLRSADPFSIKQSMAVAEAVIEEISLKNYAKPTGGLAGSPWTQADRKYFDTVDDFDVTKFTWPIDGIYTQTGTAALAGLTGYKVNQVTVAATTLNGVAAKLITVEVVDPGGAVYKLAAYRTDY
jgi:MSHA pilin protein MshD